MQKIVVITGASAGIGKATAKYFLDKGDKVYNLARRPNEETENITCDVSKKADVENAIKTIYEKEKRVDVLINSAGMGIAGPVETTEEDAIRRIFDVNFFGTVYAIQAVLPVMREIGGGTIINLSSAGAPLSLPFQAFYSSTKSAVTTLSEALRLEVKPYNIKVCSVLPGDIVTEFTKNRETNIPDSVYKERAEKSVGKMAKDELNGMQPETIAKLIYKMANKKNPPVYVVGGMSYKFFVLLSRILPKRWVVALIGKLYA